MIYISTTSIKDLFESLFENKDDKSIYELYNFLQDLDTDINKYVSVTLETLVIIGECFNSNNDFPFNEEELINFKGFHNENFLNFINNNKDLISIDDIFYGLFVYNEELFNELLSAIDNKIELLENLKTSSYNESIKTIIDRYITKAKNE